MGRKCHPHHHELAGLLLRCVDARTGWRSTDTLFGLDYIRIQDFSVAECTSTHRQMVRIIDNFLAEWMVTPSTASCDIATRFLLQTNQFDLLMADEGELPEGLRADFLTICLADNLR